MTFFLRSTFLFVLLSTSACGSSADPSSASPPRGNGGAAGASATGVGGSFVAAFGSVGGQGGASGAQGSTIAAGGAAGGAGLADGDPMASVTAFCAGTFSARLAKMDSCCSATDEETQLLLDRHNDLVAGDAACAGQLHHSLASGRITLAPEALQACLAAVQTQTASCWRGDLVAPLPAACDLVVVGTVEADGACAHAHECKAGMTCNGQTGTAEGKCSPPSVLYKACAGPETKEGDTPVLELPLGDHPACAAGICDGGKCMATHGAGDFCAGGGAPGPCLPGLACVSGADYATCFSTDGSEGSACDGSLACQPGLGCRNYVCVPSLPAGASCDPANDDCDGACTGWMFQNGVASGTCVAVCGSR